MLATFLLVLQGNFLEVLENKQTKNHKQKIQIRVKIKLGLKKARAPWEEI